MSAALDNGLSVTALHNHFFFDHPKVYFMHIEGEGSVEKLAGAVRKFTTRSKQVRAAKSAAERLVSVRQLVAREEFDHRCTSQRDLRNAGRSRRTEW